MIRKKLGGKTKGSRGPRKKAKGADSAGSKKRNGRAPKVHPAITLIEEWLKDESGYDEETWPALKKALDEERDRVGARRLFDD
jgi:hypothetical protein